MNRNKGSRKQELPQKFSAAIPIRQLETGSEEVRCQTEKLCAASASARRSTSIYRHNTVCNTGIVAVLVANLAAGGIAVIVAVSVAGVS